MTMTLAVFNITIGVEDSAMATSNLAAFSIGVLYVTTTAASLGTDLTYSIATQNRSNIPSNLDPRRQWNSSNRISNTSMDNSQICTLGLGSHVLQLHINSVVITFSFTASSNPQEPQLLCYLNNDTSFRHHQSRELYTVLIRWNQFKCRLSNMGIFCHCTRMKNRNRVSRVGNVVSATSTFELEDFL